MDVKKLKKGVMYYCLDGGRWYPSYAIVKAIYMSNAGYPYNPDLVFMEQNIDGVTHCFQVDADDIYPLDPKILSAVLHNERQNRPQFTIMALPKYDEKTETGSVKL